MLTEREVKSRVVEALEVVTPPAPWLESRILSAAEVEGRRVGRSHRKLRISLRAIAGLTLLALAVASLATFVLIRSSVTRSVPGGPSPMATPSAAAGPSSSSYSRGWAFGGPAMVTPTEGWNCCVPFEHTTDGGVHWTDVTPKGSGTYGQDYYLDAVHAWYNDWSGTGPYQLATFRTADAGHTWERGTPLTISADPQGLADFELYFMDPGHGWLLVSTKETSGNGVRYADSLYTTADGGMQWTVAAVHAAPAAWSSTKFYCYEWCGPMAFITPSTGWLSIYRVSNPAGPALLVTHDGGTTWTPQTLPRSSVACPCSAWSFLVFDESHAMYRLTGANQTPTSSVMVITSDGGKTWVVRSLPGQAQTAVGFYDVQHGWAIAGSRADLQDPQPPASLTSPTVPLPLYRTADGGSSWQRVQTSLQLQSPAGRVGPLYFVDAKVGFAVRSAGQGSRELLKTTDGGRTWQVIASSV